MDPRNLHPASIAARWNTADQAVDLVIDGRAVIDIVDPQRQHWVSPFARRFRRAAARGWLAAYRGVSDGRDERLLEEELEIAVCGACGDLDCGNLAVYVDMDANTVVWRQPHWAGDDEDDEDDEEPEANDPTLLMPQMVVFDRAKYETALADAERFINRPGWRREISEAVSWLDRLRNRFTSLWEK